MPTPLLARHITAMLRGPLGVDVVAGSLVTRGLWDERGSIDPEGVGDRYSFERVLTLNGTDARLAQDQSVTVDRVAYVVRTPPLPVEDGGLVRYGVALASPGDGTA